MSELLDPQTLAKLRPVGLRAQRIAEGLWAGIHPSRLKGASLEFSEHKQYSPGDELRHLDWKVFAKSDRLFVKQFEDETNIQALFVLDTSGSMGYCSRAMAPPAEPAARGPTGEGEGPVPAGPVSKLAYGTRLVAALAYLLQGQQDAIGLAAGAAGLDAYLPPRRGPRQLAQLLQSLESLTSRGESHLTALLRPLLEAQRRKSLVVIVSDLFDSTPADWRALRQLRARGNELVLFHLLDPYEVHFPFQGWSDFEGLEGESPIQVDPMAQREDYLRRMNGFLEEVRERCVATEASYVRVLTSEPVDQPLLEYLLGRRGGARR